MESQVREVAAEYIARGWAPLRCAPGAKGPIGAWKDHDYTPDEFQPGDNIAIKLGKPSAWIVDVDLDSPVACAIAPRLLPDTATFGHAVKPRSHWIYHAPDCGTTRPRLAHVELRSTGSYTVFPGSHHAQGGLIQWTDGTPITSLDSDTLRAAFHRLALATIIGDQWLQLVGDRHTAALAFAGALWHEGFTLAETQDVLLPAFALAGNNDEHQHREQAIIDTYADDDRERTGWPTVEELIGSALVNAAQGICRKLHAHARAVRVAQGESPYTDAGNVDRFAAFASDIVRYVPGLGWLEWRDTHWIPRDGGRPTALVIACARACEDRDWGVKWESSRAIDATARLAEDHPAFKLLPSELDADPWLFNCTNGTLDLRSGAVREHRPDDFLTRIAGAGWNPNASAPRFEQFLAEIFRGDRALMVYMLEYLGSALAGLPADRVIQVWHGSGANGKSTLASVLAHVFGDYATSAPAGLFMHTGKTRDAHQHAAGFLPLRGRRWIYTSETDQSQAWNAATVKTLTGRDDVTARAPYARVALTIPPTWHMSIATNHPPRVYGNDPAIFSRVHLIPFSTTFNRATQDPQLPDTLRAEAGGILRLLVAGFQRWIQLGRYSVPPAVVAESANYQQDNDEIGQFLEEVCDRGADLKCERKQLWKAWARWVEDDPSASKLGRSAFYKSVPFPRIKVKGAYFFTGIALKGPGTL